MTNNIIETIGLTKSYGSNSRALDGLDMIVPEGVVYGLLGQNGAGKTTTLRIFMSLLKPGSGQVTVMGNNPWNMAADLRQQIGYTSDSMQLIPWLKVGDILNYNGSFYKNWDSNYVKQWVERLNLPLNKRVFHLSRGNRQKLGLIMAIGHRPKLLILDEPAGGLDPLARKDFLESMIELIHESGTTIVLSSHLLSDLERISDCIGIIDQGKMKVEMNLEILKNTTRQIKIVSRNRIENINLEGLIKLQKSDNVMTGVFRDWDEKKHFNLKQRFPEATIEIETLNLEEIFLAYTHK
jgi:ABC-2 type transport system ATP-binding protein